MVVASAIGAVTLIDRGSLPRGTTIGGVEVGGMSEAEARAVVERAATARVVRRIRLVAPGGALAETSGRELRAEPLVAEALAEARNQGTIGRVLARVGLRDGPHADLAYRLAPVAAARLADRLDDRFGDAWRDGRVEVGAGSIRVVAARPGTASTGRPCADRFAPCPPGSS